MSRTPKQRPGGKPALKTRQETDSFGPIKVPAERLWGAQTQRSLEFFAIGEERMPWPIIVALIQIKIAAARVNSKQGLIPLRIARAIDQAGHELLSDGSSAQAEFPLSVWQTGSGTQTNMNVNEVLANRANEIMGARRGARAPVHPNDHVNRSQSSNDAFPSAMHIAAAAMIADQTLPALKLMKRSLEGKARAWQQIVKVGRTHMQDATPITLGQEFSGYAAQIGWGIDALEQALRALYPLALGGTAVGTGLNAPVDFGRAMAQELARITGRPFRPGENFFAMLAGHEALVNASAALNTLAASLAKIANDIRLMGSGPRAGLGELRLPENEPGSSIMPGKVNPTQVEALTQICAQVMGNHVAITLAASQGQFELNVYKPLIIYNFLQSARLIADAVRSFTDHCLKGLEPDRKRLKFLMDQSLMLVTALALQIGYDAAAGIAKAAHAKGISLRDAALEFGIKASDFDKLVDPKAMLGPLSAKGRRGK